MERVTLPRVARQSQMSLSRATVRSVEDKHLIQEVKEADVYHSETASNKGAPFERFQFVGITAVPLKQFEDSQQQKQAQQQQDDGFNHNQPKGKSAEAIMLYLNGSRSHPVALIDDRRVRPYNAKEGDAMLYHASGTEQKAYITDSGVYLLANNNASVEKGAKEKERVASLRHVNLKKQTHEIKEGEQVEEHNHEGDEVNTDVRCSKNRIEFYDGNTVVGYYDRTSQTWYFKGKIAQMEFDEKVETKAPTISNEASTRFETVGPSYIGIDSKGGDAPKGETGDVPYKKTYVKLEG